ncbi:uncharacterized protein LOC110007097 [Amborella trichopoda]|uniref:uncharacterized protein LOC110007097 n=1 Tax=Amborella trichopoda TaxID=13333 RepID=UPI0009BD8327|nr:uncharacterized protein LOC110007097 [Amborella trichopoda]|eukprot:XP_020521829.1 uncharacterized protein LOC110007097 [Amborella trichopoda]
MNLPKYSWDLALVPLSLLLIACYYAILWYNVKKQPLSTRIGVDRLRWRHWVQTIMHENDEKKGLLAVQTQRNNLMTQILASTITILINSSLASLANNSYMASHFLPSPLLGSIINPTMAALKFATPCIFFLFSFLSSSLSLQFHIHANFLLGLPPYHPSKSTQHLEQISQNSSFQSSDSLSSLEARKIEPEHVYWVVERGCCLGSVGSRALHIGLVLTLWVLGSVPLVLASVALVMASYELDFAPGRFNGEGMASSEEGSSCEREGDTSNL